MSAAWERWAIVAADVLVLAACVAQRVRGWSLNRNAIQQGSSRAGSLSWTLFSGSTDHTSSSRARLAFSRVIAPCIRVCAWTLCVYKQAATLCWRVKTRPSSASYTPPSLCRRPHCWRPHSSVSRGAARPVWYVRTRCAVIVYIVKYDMFCFVRVFQCRNAPALRLRSCTFASSTHSMSAF
jgi:hypothetical protein